MICIMSNDSEDIEAKEKEALGNDPWMETYTGKKFFLGHDLNLDQINIEDIAHSWPLIVDTTGTVLDSIL